MPKKARAEPKGKINLCLSARTRTQLESLQKILDADSISEVVRRAVDAFVIQTQLEKAANQRLCSK